MKHQRIVPTNEDGVEDRFHGRQDPNDTYDGKRCRTCGIPWGEHATLSPSCIGKRPVNGTLFDLGGGDQHKGAYS